MPYANANTEIKTYTGFTTDYSTSTSPTLSQVTDIIEQVEGEIEVALSGLGLTVPVTNTILLDFVRKYSGMGSAGLVFQRYGKSENDFRLGDWYYTKFENWIEKLINDKNYQGNIKEIVGANTYTGLYIGSNATDTTHTGTTPKTTEISYGVEGFK